MSEHASGPVSHWDVVEISDHLRDKYQDMHTAMGRGGQLLVIAGLGELDLSGEITHKMHVRHGMPSGSRVQWDTPGGAFAAGVRFGMLAVEAGTNQSLSDFLRFSNLSDALHDHQLNDPERIDRVTQRALGDNPGYAALVEESPLVIGSARLAASNLVLTGAALPLVLHDLRPLSYDEAAAKAGEIDWGLITDIGDLNWD